MHGEIHFSLHACTNDYLRCMQCEVHDYLRKHVIRCTKKVYQDFQFLKAWSLLSRVWPDIAKVSIISKAFLICRWALVTPWCHHDSSVQSIFGDFENSPAVLGGTVNAQACRLKIFSSSILIKFILMVTA